MNSAFAGARDFELFSDSDSLAGAFAVVGVLKNFIEDIDIRAVRDVSLHHSKQTKSSYNVKRVQRVGSATRITSSTDLCKHVTQGTELSR